MLEIIIIAFFICGLMAYFQLKFIRESRRSKLNRIQRELAKKEAAEKAREKEKQEKS